MINECRQWGIPEPEFEDTGTSLVVTFRKIMLTEDLLVKFGLNDRQIKAIEFIRERGKISNFEYRELNNVSNKTAYMDLSKLVDTGILVPRGRGKYLYYR